MLRGTVGEEFIKRACTRYDELTHKLFSIFRYFPDRTKYLLFQFYLCQSRFSVFVSHMYLTFCCVFMLNIFSNINRFQHSTTKLGSVTNICFRHQSINHHESILDNSPSSSKARYILFVNATVFKSRLFSVASYMIYLCSRIQKYGALFVNKVI